MASIRNDDYQKRVEEARKEFEGIEDPSESRALECLRERRAIRRKLIRSPLGSPAFPISSPSCAAHRCARGFGNPTSRRWAWRSRPG